MMVVQWKWVVIIDPCSWFDTKDLIEISFSEKLTFEAIEVF